MLTKMTKPWQELARRGARPFNVQFHRGMKRLVTSSTPICKRGHSVRADRVMAAAVAGVDAVGGNSDSSCRECGQFLLVKRAEKGKNLLVQNRFCPVLEESWQLLGLGDN
jgi:hypothetical protein